MAYGYIRIRNLDPGSVPGTEQHNARLYEQMPANIKKDSPYGENVNQYYGSLPDQKLTQVIDQRLKNHGIQLRKNQNCAIEFVVGASADFWNKYSPQGHFSNVYRWLEDRYGKGSVVARSEHYDESNPHCHFIVVPIEKKTIKWKNRNGSGSREEDRLAIREITGGREKLRKLQDDYFAFIQPFGEKYGIEFKRGKLKAKDSLDEYSQQTNHELGEIRAKLAAISDEREKLQYLIDLQQKTAEIEANAADLAKKVQKEKQIRKLNFKRGIGAELDTPRKRKGPKL